MTIDIHPHIISTDIVRHPNAPLGGHKSASCGRIEELFSIVACSPLLILVARL